MARPSITPLDAERAFDVRELFFSTTDRKGLIRSGNRVFARVSGYREAELLGEPHNLVRHPDMPRAVFQLLWEYLQSGRPIAAYVKNLASDGSFYWVLATAVPLEEGYLSVRLKPTSDLLPVVAGLYAELRDIERGIEDAGGLPREAMAASRLRLCEALEALGFADYDAFMRVALPSELRARQAALASNVAPRLEVPRNHQLHAVMSACRTLERYLYRRFDEIDHYQQINHAFAEGSEFVLRLAEDIRLFSLNAQIGAARLREAGAALGVIADLMRSRSDAAARETHEIRAEIEAVVAVLHTLAFDISLATLQSEMAASFVHELASSPDEGGATEDALASTVANVGALGYALRSRVEPLMETLAHLEARLASIAGAAGALSGELARFDALQSPVGSRRRGSLRPVTSACSSIRSASRSRGVARTSDSSANSPRTGEPIRPTRARSRATSASPGSRTGWQARPARPPDSL